MRPCPLWVVHALDALHLYADLHLMARLDNFSCPAWFYLQQRQCACYLCLSAKPAVVVLGCVVKRDLRSARAAKKYAAFLASEAVIKQIPRLLGPGLNKAGKFPTLVTHNDKLEDKVPRGPSCFLVASSGHHMLSQLPANDFVQMFCRGWVQVSHPGRLSGSALLLQEAFIARM